MILRRFNEVLSDINQQAKLVVVSKYQSIENIRVLYEAGHRDFGENYLQGLEARLTELPDDIRWHFLGHLHRKKVNRLVRIPNLVALHSLDSIELADKLNEALKVQQRTLDCYIEVNLSREPSKSGLQTVEDCQKLVHHVKTLEFLRVQGLMTLGRQGDPSAFVELRQVRDLHFPGLQLNMGMSDSYREALKESADVVRIGRTLFPTEDPVTVV